MLGRTVTREEIIAAIFEMMPDDTLYTIDASGGGGFFVRINNFPYNVLLRDESTFYQKLNDYCVRVEDWKARYPATLDAYGHPYSGRG